MVDPELYMTPISSGIYVPGLPGSNRSRSDDQLLAIFVDHHTEILIYNGFLDPLFCWVDDHPQKNKEHNGNLDPICNSPWTNFYFFVAMLYVIPQRERLAIG